MITFKYLKEGLGGIFGNVTLRPVATVYLQGTDNKWYTFQPYIDSGADITLLPMSIGELIGLNATGKKIDHLGGISNGVPVIYTIIHMKIDDKEFDARVAWAQIHDTPPLLGRTDIFNKFTITFDEKHEEIIFGS